QRPPSFIDARNVPPAIARCWIGACGNPEPTRFQVSPESREMYNPFSAEATSVCLPSELPASGAESSHSAAPAESGKSCQLQVFPASSEKTIPRRETIHKLSPSVETLTLRTGKVGSGPSDMSVQFSPL